jgi:3-methyladenine DNA glycosylase Tag
MTPAQEQSRCHWAKSPAMIAYHDEEWGVPLHDDSRARRRSVFSSS